MHRLLPTAAAAAVALLAAAVAAPAAGDAPASAAADSAAFVVVRGDTLWLAAPVEVLGSRVPVALPGIVRGVALLDGDELASRPARSVAGLLQAFPAVVAGQRHHDGAQADLSIRGSTFDQVQVLLDGFDMSDPQTGHHLLDLPLGTHDVDRLEVLPGHGSAQYGSGAFGGTVNVVTRRPGERAGGEVGVLAGGDGTWGDWGSAVTGGDAVSARFSAERFRTDGHGFARDDGTTVQGGTDADLWSATGRVVGTGTAGEVDAFVGFAHRAFGALDFYAPYPSWERTRTWAGTLKVNRRVGDRLTLEPRFCFRRHEDRFVLVRTSPDAYANDHVSGRYAGELRGLVDLGGGRTLAAGVEGVYEDITSTGVRDGVRGPALGDHLRRRLSLSAEVDGHGTPLRWQVGGRVDLRSSLDPRASFTAAVSRDLGGPFAVRAGAGSIHRVPTFTDLHYADPANVGNPDLRPEHGWAWDAGVEATGGPWQASATWFERHETDLIDWARPAGGTVWQVLNVAEGTARGVEVAAAWRGSGGHRLAAGWAWLERTTSLRPGYEAKYALLVPRHNLTCSGTAVLPAGFAATVALRYVERSGGPGAFRIAGAVDARLDWTSPAGWFAALTGTNLGDRRVMEVPGVVLPGARLTGSAGLRF